jgi:hypothetical protein
MATLTYADAMGEALDRLRGIGYEHGGKLVNHAPMAAEALATMGYADIVPTWVDHNLKVRRYHERPEPRWTLATDDWQQALGDFGRVADWSAMFERELAARPWVEVLQTWWPRLLPGMSGVMTHGVIRTAHAVRSMAQASGDDQPQRAELAQGLGYWAARYSTHVPSAVADDSPVDGDGALAAFDELVAVSSGHYVRTKQGHPVPLIHAITGPAAVRLVCQYLPADQHWPSYQAARGNSEWMRSYYGASNLPADDDIEPLEPQAEAEATLIADAVELGDEHAIKLAEVAIRHNAFAPDHRYAVASHAATAQLRAFGGNYYG